MINKIIQEIFALIAAQLIKQLSLQDFRVAVVNLEEGDYVILKCKTSLSNAALALIEKNAQTIFSNQKIVVIDGDADVVFCRDKND